MPAKEAVPYLFFNGEAEKALALYERALGAKVTGLMRYAQMPAGAPACPAEDEQRVMHAVAVVGGAKIMVSDSPAGKPSPVGANVQVVLDYDDVDEMTRAFEALAASGKVHMPLHDSFWGAKFGALVDEVGVHWMFNCTRTPS